MKRKLSELSIQSRIKSDHCTVDSYTFFLFYWFFSSSFKTNQRKLEQLNSKKIKEKPRSLINIKMTNILMLLRKCCNHPYLLEYPFNPENDELLIDENLVKVSGKMMVLDQMLPALKARGHKVWESNESELLSDKQCFGIYCVEIWFAKFFKSIWTFSCTVLEKKKTVFKST